MKRTILMYVVLVLLYVFSITGNAFADQTEGEVFRRFQETIVISEHEGLSNAAIIEIGKGGLILRDGADNFVFYSIHKRV